MSCIAHQCDIIPNNIYTGVQCVYILNAELSTPIYVGCTFNVYNTQFSIQFNHPYASMHIKMSSIQVCVCVCCRLFEIFFRFFLFNCLFKLDIEILHDNRHAFQKDLMCSNCKMSYRQVAITQVRDRMELFQCLLKQK